MTQIRQAAINDVSRIAEILVFSKRLNYRSIFQDDAVSFGMIQVLPAAHEYLNDPTLLSHTWVYEDTFVKGLIEIDNQEVKTLYVDTFFTDEGIGEKLLSFAKERFHVNSLWVLEKNTRAIAFYERNGFCKAQEWKYEGDSKERIIRMKCVSNCEIDS